MEDKDKNCVFCILNDREITAQNNLAYAFYDQYPVNEGHSLIVPRRHVEQLFDATFEELDAINRLVFEVKDILEEKYRPDGYNVGVNVGLAAGQTIFHLHIHVIPRYIGDAVDPRGGIRKIKKNMVPYPAKEKPPKREK